MSDDWRDDPAWRMLASLHRLLLRLAGQVPDDLISHARGMLATGDWAYLPDALAGSLAELGVPLTTDEVELLYGALAAMALPGDPPLLLGRVRVVPVPPASASRYWFAPVPSAAPAAGIDLTGELPAGSVGSRDALTDLTDELVADTLADAAAEAQGWARAKTWIGAGGPTWSEAGTGGAVGVWRAWRYAPDAVGAQGERVFLAEVMPGVPAWKVAGAAQRELSEVGGETPRVEVYWSGDVLTPYQRAARSHAALLWASRPGQVRLAPVYGDRGAAGVSGRGQFDADHPLITDTAERERLLALLRDGVPAAQTDTRDVDVVDPARGAVVPRGYRTDGRWVWPEAVGYYLAEYGLAPQGELLAHLRTAGGSLPPVDGVALFRAEVAVAAATGPRP